jgi:hypothetical protein
MCRWEVNIKMYLEDKGGEYVMILTFMQHFLKCLRYVASDGRMFCQLRIGGMRKEAVIAHFVTIPAFARVVIAQSVQRQGYGLDDRGSRVRNPAEAGNFSLHHRVQNGSGAHPASYPMGTGGSLPGGKAAGT